MKKINGVTIRHFWENCLKNWESPKQLAQECKATVINSEQHGGWNRILTNDLLHAGIGNDVIETVSATPLALNIVETVVGYDRSEEEEEQMVETTVEEKLKHFAKACHVLDSAEMVTDPVDCQIGHAQRALRAEKEQTLRRTLLATFSAKRVKLFSYLHW